MDDNNDNGNYDNYNEIDNDNDNNNNDSNNHIDDDLPWGRMGPIFRR